MSNLFDLKTKTLAGEETTLSPFSGKVILIVNTASKCGFTPQYQGLQATYDKFKDRGFVVLGFPCNQFGQQEPGSSEDIAQFCEKNYGVTFPMFEKIDVNGASAHPIFEALKRDAPGLLGTTAIKWNFTKFLVSRDGKVIKRYAPKDAPAKIERDIEALL